MGKPEATKFHRRLEKLAGHWSADEKLFGSSDRPAEEKAKSTTTASLGFDGYYLIIDYTQKIQNRISFRGHGVCGWDPSKQRYTLYWFDTTGYTPSEPALGVWDGDVLTFHRKTPDGRHCRFLCTLSGKDGYTLRFEETTDGVSWRPILDAKLLRRR